MNINFNPFLIYNYRQYSQNIAFNGTKINEPKISITKIKTYIEKENRSVKEIASLYNTTTQTIYNVLNKFGIYVPKEIKKIKQDRLIRDLLNSSDGQEVRSFAEIAKKTGISTFIVKRWFAENKVEFPRVKRQKNYIALLKSNLSDKEIAEKLGIDILAVYSLRRRFGIKAWRVRKEDKIELVINELKNGLSIKEVAEKLKISKDTIYRYLRWQNSNKK